jgi:Cation transport ATPase
MVADQGEVLRLAAIVDAARNQGLELARVETFESSSGIGVRGIVEGRQLVLGNTVLMQQEGIDVAALLQTGETQRQQGASVMYLAGQCRPLLAARPFGGAYTRIDVVRDSGAKQ